MSAAGVVSGATPVIEADGWALVDQVRRTRYALTAKCVGARHWSKTEIAARYLRELGITQFRVDARELDAAACAKIARPGSSAKPKNKARGSGLQRMVSRAGAGSRR